MKNLIQSLILVSLMISCTKESVDPELTLHERLEQFANSSDKIGLVNDGDLESYPNFRTDSDSNENIVSEISFEIFDYSVILEDYSVILENE